MISFYAGGKLLVDAWLNTIDTAITVMTQRWGKWDRKGEEVEVLHGVAQELSST